MEHQAQLPEDIFQVEAVVLTIIIQVMDNLEQVVEDVQEVLEGVPKVRLQELLTLVVAVEVVIQMVKPVVLV
tara:strand:- start:27 stop:242 length:216 start_codon:yes stop_codon:yes gene_type:complete